MFNFLKRYSINSVEQLDDYINGLNDNRKSGKDQSSPSMSPKIQELFNHYNMARFMAQTGNLGEAFGTYVRILKVEPSFTAARYNLAYIMRLNGKPEEALNQLKIAAQYNPKDPEIFIQIGVIYSELDLKDKEIEAYQQALKISPDHFLAAKNIGQTYREIGDLENSLLWLNRTIKLIDDKAKDSLPGAWDKEYLMTYLELGNLYREKGDDAIAEDMFRKGERIGRNSKSFDVQFRQTEITNLANLASILIQKSQWQEAESILLECINRNPTGRQAYQSMLAVVKANQRISTRESLDHDEPPTSVEGKTLTEENEKEDIVLCEELALIEKQILNKEALEEHRIREMIKHAIRQITSFEVKMNWESHYLPEHEKGLPTGRLVPWPVLLRLEGVFSQYSEQWKDPKNYSLYLALLETLGQRYDKAYNILNQIRFDGGYPLAGFELQRNVMFKLGLYQQGVRFIQNEMLRNKDYIASLNQTYESPTSINNILNSLNRQEIVLINIPDTLPAVPEPYDPTAALLEALGDLAMLTLEKGRINYQSFDGPDELLTQAHHFHHLYQLPLALEYYKEYLVAVPDDAESWYLLGTVFMLLTQYREAYPCFQKAACDPAYKGSALLSIGEIALRIRQFQQAEKHYKQAVEFLKGKPDYEIAMLHAGYCRELLGDFKGALQCYKDIQQGMFADISKTGIRFLEYRMNG